MEAGDNLSATSYGEYVVVVVIDDSLDSGAKSGTGEGEFENGYRSISSSSMTLNEEPIWSSSSPLPSTTYSNTWVKRRKNPPANTRQFDITKTIPGSERNGTRPVELYR